jgi:maleate cis-trans isomerase
MAPVIPGDVSVEFHGLDLYGNNLYEIEGKKKQIIEKTKDLVKTHRWDGIMVTAAPPEVLNPGLFDDLKAALSIPVTTALNACIAALRAFSARRVLLLTPFDKRLNDLICAHLDKSGVAATAPRPFDNLGDAIKLKPEEVFDHTQKALREVGTVDAIYFQGAVLDPIKVLDKIERELKTTVVASNPSMLWFMLAKLGHTYHIPGFGKLPAEWPVLTKE